MIKKNNRKQTMGRFNFFITKRNHNIINKISKLNSHSMGDILNGLIEKHLDDPSDLLKEKKRLLIFEINKLDDQIKKIQEYRDSKKH